MCHDERKRRAFTAAYKTEVVELIRASGKSIGAVAQDLGLTETAVRAWVQRAEVEAGGGPAAALTMAEGAELTDLRRRVKTLEMERDVQKSRGLFRQEPSVVFAWIDAERERAEFPITKLCQ